MNFQNGRRWRFSGKNFNNTADKHDFIETLKKKSYFIVTSVNQFLHISQKYQYLLKFCCKTFNFSLMKMK